jgi:ABC-type branched-subunit amino acid transport system ATPase component
VDRAVISVRGLRKRYGALEAVAGIDLEVLRGEIFAFLGPNGLRAKSLHIQRNQARSVPERIRSNP